MLLRCIVLATLRTYVSSNGAIAKPSLFGGATGAIESSRDTAASQSAIVDRKSKIVTALADLECSLSNASGTFVRAGQFCSIPLDGFPVVHVVACGFHVVMVVL